VIGYDFVTYVDTPWSPVAPVESAVAPVESAVAPVESAVVPLKRYNRIIIEVEGEELSFYDTDSESYTPNMSPVSLVESVVDHMPRRSKRIRVARDFYYGY
jgi:hypothetical protein